MKDPILYEKIKEIITSILEPRTQALVAFQYASGCRVGELCYEYTHTFQETTKDEQGNIIKVKKWKEKTEGLEWENVVERMFVVKKGGLVKETKTVPGIVIQRPSFKQGNHKIGETSSVVLQTEQWLYDIILNWRKIAGNRKFVFYLKEARARQLIKKAVGKSSHYLRHSRGFHLREIFDCDAYEIQKQLGHKNIQTSVIYTHASIAGIAKKMGQANV